MAPGSAPVAVEVQEAPLAVSLRVVDPDNHRPALNPDATYTAIQLEQYDGRARCAVCESSSKTTTRILLGNPEDGSELYCGPCCLKIQFGQTFEHLLSGVGPEMGLAEAWLSYIQRATNQRVNGSLDFVLAVMEEAFASCVSFECGANEVAGRRFGLLRDRAQDPRTRDPRTVQALRLLIGLHHDHGYIPNLFRDRLTALAAHPRLTPPQRAIARVIHDNVEGTTWPRLLALSDVLDAAIKNRRRVPDNSETDRIWLKYGTARAGRHYLEDPLSGLTIRSML